MSVATGRCLSTLAASLCVSLALVVSAGAQGAREDTPPREPETLDIDRIFLDTQVADVAVDEVTTVVTMAESPRSPCRSPYYIYQRDRPKWLYQTGRFLVAMEENAEIRVSFSCVQGVQVINAMMFLSPPPAMMVSGMPDRSRTVAAQTSRPRQLGSVPLPPGPTEARASARERVRTIPLP